MQDAPVQSVEPSRELPYDTLIALGGLLALLIYCFWNSLSLLVPYWDDPRYSHGWLVPVFAAALLWLRWDPAVLQRLDSVPAVARWWGVGLLMAGLSMRLISATMGTEVPDMVSFLPSAAGVVLLVGGWRMLIWTAPVIAFLFFMFPLPYTVADALLNPLQKIATIGATYLLQTFGYGAFREGNKILIGELKPLEVVEACSGLRMLTVFTAMTAAVAIVIDRPYWERAILFFSSIPIALAVNIIRITLTGVGYYHGGDPWREFFHDYAAWYMMAIAALLLWLEISILGKLFVDAPPAANPMRGARPTGRPSKPDPIKAPRHRETSGGSRAH
ncbi:MAG: exosortase/archaeosortase family protein [Planctomycetes bacterium]|nr:exosortase/archaeosortase family protein [Planctomycetota bacterium]